MSRAKSVYSESQVVWIFYLAGALGLFILRVREPDTPRPYQVWGYPPLPAVFGLFAATYVVITLRQDFRNSVFGPLLVGLGVPLCLYWRRRRARSAG